MKRCPTCRRDYHNDSLSYCLDDGSELLDGPASGNELATVMLPGEAGTGDDQPSADVGDPLRPETRPEPEERRDVGRNILQRGSMWAALVMVIVLIGGLAYWFTPRGSRSASL